MADGRMPFHVAAPDFYMRPEECNGCLQEIVTDYRAKPRRF